MNNEEILKDKLSSLKLNNYEDRYMLLYIIQNVLQSDCEDIKIILNNYIEEQLNEYINTQQQKNGYYQLNKKDLGILNILSYRLFLKYDPDTFYFKGRII